MGWRVWIDRGGTFTDVLALAPSGELGVRKVLSAQPGVAGDPAVNAIRQLLGLADTEPLRPGVLQELRLGTTVATNALLEQRGAPVLLLINQGFADLLRIGDLQRPDLFALQISRELPLDLAVVEVAGRLAADGTELEPLQCDAALAAQVRQALADGYRSIAVALLHSYRNPAHELQLGGWLADLGAGSVTLSHQLSRLPRLVPRGQTALVEATLAPVLRRYLDQVEGALGGAVPLRVMRSSGALAPRAWLQAKDTILSGPAGGMVGAMAAAREALALAGLPLQPLVGFDMGGTSTDVFHCACGPEGWQWQRQPQTTLAGLQLQAPMLPIHTVAAGGGSILRFEQERLQVGPQSAGADPGPVAYRRGGPLTITDANLLLGRLPPQALPAVFGPQGDQPADCVAVQQRFAAMAAAMAPSCPGITPEQVAKGALQIAIETMAGAIRRISLEQGHDPREALLVSYGGAAGQHACRLAAELGMGRVLLHPLAGVLSAYGIGMAPQSHLAERTIAQPLNVDTLAALVAVVQELGDEGTRALAAMASGVVAPAARVQLELRQPAQERGFVVPWCPAPSQIDGIEGLPTAVAALGAAYGRCHQRQYGYAPTSAELIVERVLVEQVLAEPAATALVAPPSAGRQGGAATTPLWSLELQQWQQVPVWTREALSPGQPLQGPALVLDPTSTLVLEPGWSLRKLANGALLLEAHTAAAPTPAASAPVEAPVDPVRLELYHHRFAAIATQMGVQLQHSARSLNIRERLDFSCAVFDGCGALVANAPHIPVHLGSMGDSVISLLQAINSGARAPLAPGDVVLSNNPYNGGTHLPDITAITPVFAADAAPGASPVLFVASRGHHADVGGITPGSMPASSHCIDDEGLLLDNALLLSQGAIDEAAWRRRFGAGRHPVRDPDLLLADLLAQVAANRRGVEALQALIDREGLDQVQAYMAHVQANAAAAVRRLIPRLREGSAELHLDDGALIAVAVSVDRNRQRLRIDFSGSSSQHPGNRNAPLAVTRAVVLYVIRTLVAETIPLNAGCFAPIELIVPAGTLLNPLPPAAVVAGNVEVSQAAANALLLALGAQAASQGTMNNLSFGNGQHQYYETIGGGCGAGAGYAGGSAVQSHMTNSRLTDPEILEARLPLRLERLAVRQGSGGGGQWRGGDGVIRQLRFLAPMQLSLISGSRQVAPPGLAGGCSGALGRNLLLHSDGEQQELPGCCELLISPGQALRIETPGGGGYGVPIDQD